MGCYCALKFILNNNNTDNKLVWGKQVKFIIFDIQLHTYTCHNKYGTKFTKYNYKYNIINGSGGWENSTHVYVLIQYKRYDVI